ncbi:Rrf2 family transcriptional regulator [Rhodoblastus sp.]|jgi:Rrf2 family protein|uniref:Rrf2 family transcriptional regulator n=1 Tax=Rhodoblastus sp. TaxID=1962975 RepID=UPI0026052CA3|nr:Rrf2 family transcriptional regulator [Rhodoblastus sp.]
MKLQKATLCGLYAVTELAAHVDRQISAAEIAAKYDISLNHLAKVLRTLVRANVIESVRGVGGGYRFCGNAKRVTLYDLVMLFEEIGPSAQDAPPTDFAEGRALGKVLREIDEIALASLRATSIAALVKVIQKETAADPSAAKASHKLGANA